MKNHDGQPKHEGCNPGVKHPHRFYCPTEIEMVAEREQDAIIEDLIRVAGLGESEGVRSIILARRIRTKEADPWVFRPSTAPRATYAFAIPASQGDRQGVHVSLNADPTLNAFLEPIEAARTIRAMTKSLDAVLDKHDSIEFVTHVRKMMEKN